MPALSDLEARFLRYDKRDDGKTYHVTVPTIAEAQGVIFLCPKCFAQNGGAVGTHSVVCWSSSRGIADDVDPKPGRWTLEGTGLPDLTLGCEAGKSRSVLLIGGCGWHGFVTNGMAE